MTLVDEATTRLLRELSDDDFHAAYDCDRFSAAVLASRFRYIIEHVSNRLITYAFSPVIRESGDMSATLTGPPSIDHAMAAVSQTIPLFYGSMQEAVRIALEEHGIDELVPGDVIMVNDPYRVGTHLNDVCFIQPVFDDERILGAITIRAHMLDWGGKAIGGFEVTKKDLYEDGLVFPPTLLYHAGKPVRSTFNLVLDHGQLIADSFADEVPLRSNSARSPHFVMRTRTTDGASARRPSLSSHSSPSYTPSGSAASASRIVSADASQA